MNPISNSNSIPHQYRDIRSYRAHINQLFSQSFASEISRTSVGLMTEI